MGIVETLAIEIAVDIDNDFDSGLLRSRTVNDDRRRNDLICVDHVAPDIVVADWDHNYILVDAPQRHPSDQYVDGDIHVSVAVADDDDDGNDDDTSDFGIQVVDADYSVEAADAVGHNHIDVGILVADGEIVLVAQS